jgi:protein-tyrosine phosphatase
MPSVLFVCTANQGRSPIAEAIFRRLINEKLINNQDWRIGSAGTWAQPGKPAASGARILMADRGMDISRHRSRPVTLKLITSSDLILTMESGQKESLHIEFASATNKVFLLSEMTGEVIDVQDPINGTLTDYQDVADCIQDLVEHGFEKICDMAIKNEQNQKS